MGAPVGNMNAAKFKPVYDSLRKAIIQDDKGRLNAGAQALLNKYAEGDLAAIGFVRDTTEGKPGQGITVANEPGESFRIDKVVREIVYPKHPDR